jgi:hypothetical protein
MREGSLGTKRKTVMPANAGTHDERQDASAATQIKINVGDLGRSVWVPFSTG